MSIWEHASVTFVKGFPKYRDACYPPYVREPHSRPEGAVTERQWIAAAVKHARESRGLTQRHLAELCQVAGLAWTVKTVGNIELAAKDVSIVELLVLCVALETTPNQLLYPDPFEGEVTPELVEVSPGKAWITYALGELLDGNTLTGDTAYSWTLDSYPPEVVRPEEVLEVAALYGEDPDAVTIAEATGMGVDEVRDLLTQLGPEMLRLEGIRTRRRRMTTRETVDLLTEHFLGDEAEKATPHARRAKRARAVQHVSDMIIEARSKQ